MEAKLGPELGVQLPVLSFTALLAVSGHLPDPEIWHSLISIKVTSTTSGFPYTIVHYGSQSLHTLPISVIANLLKGGTNLNRTDLCAVKAVLQRKSHQPWNEEQVPITYQLCDLSSFFYLSAELPCLTHLDTITHSRVIMRMKVDLFMWSA